MTLSHNGNRERLRLIEKCFDGIHKLSLIGTVHVGAAQPVAREAVLCGLQGLLARLISSWKSLSLIVCVDSGQLINS